MKKHSKNFKASIFVILFVALIYSSACAFDFTEDVDPNEIDVWDLVLEENLNYPPIPSDVVSEIRQIIKSDYTKLKKLGYDVSLIRNDEVIKITISIDNLFEFDSSEFLVEDGAKYFEPLIPYIRVTDAYRVIMVAHHDFSLESEEAEELTYNRVINIIKWLKTKHANAKNIIPYSMGNDDPLTSDKSKKGQKKNRRLDVYILPGKYIIKYVKEK